MIETRYNIKIEIDGRSFAIAVFNPTKEQKAELEAFAKKELAPIEANLEISKKRAEMEIELEALEADKKCLEGILDESSVFEKIVHFKELRELSKKIAALKKERLALGDPVWDMEKAQENIAAKKYAMLVSGETDELKEALEKGGVSFRRLWDEIQVEVGKASEKK